MVDGIGASIPDDEKYEDMQKAGIYLEIEERSA
jgi:hypothetical protein